MKNPLDERTPHRDVGRYARIANVVVHHDYLRMFGASKYPEFAYLGLVERKRIDELDSPGARISLQFRLVEIETGDPTDYIAKLTIIGASIVDRVFKIDWVIVNVVHAVGC